MIYSDSTNLILDAVVGNVATDPPLTAAELLRFYNDAYGDVWQASGGSAKSVAGGTAWTPAPTSTTSGQVTGLLTDINEVLHAWATLTVGNVGGEADSFEMRRVELSEIQYLRSSSGLGTYIVPKMYALTRKQTTTAADINKLTLDVWPGVAAYYFPIQYMPQFSPLTGTGTEVPDVNDMESRDICYIAAMAIAPTMGRPELVTTIAAKVSEKTRLGMERRMSALLTARQDT